QGTPVVGAPAKGTLRAAAGLAVGSDGTMLIATGTSVVSVAPDGTIAAVHPFSGQTFGSSVPVAATPDGGFVVGTPNGVVRVAADGSQTTLTPHQVSAVAALPDGRVA